MEMKVGLLTNEIPPIVYGGVATWIINFLNMFAEDDDIEIIPVFLAQFRQVISPNDILGLDSFMGQTMLKMHLQI